jgi:hypothetical protein
MCRLREKVQSQIYNYKAKAVPLHSTKALGGRVGMAPAHSRRRH